LASLIVGLAVLSAIPLLNLLSLGYLLHVSGRIATTGKLRAGFAGIRQASLAGSVLLGTWLVSLPPRAIAGFWQDAELVAPGTSVTRNWQWALMILLVLSALHVAWACLRGGRLHHFLWPAPLRLLRWLQADAAIELGPMRRRLLAYLQCLRLPYLFASGLRGLCGAALWLSVPVALLILGSELSPKNGGTLLSLAGALSLMIATFHLPFLQTRSAIDHTYAAFLQPGTVLQMFTRAPVAMTCSLSLTLLLALPLCLLKIELPPREMIWLPGILFIALALPARCALGWAVGRAMRRPTPRHWLVSTAAAILTVPILMGYALWIYLMQYLSWNGSWNLLEQHAFTVPSPWPGF